MDKLPSPFWAVLLAFLGAALCAAVLYHQGDINIGHDVLTIASNLVSGALGAFAGHAAAKSDVTMGNGGVIVNPTDPK